MGKQVYQPKKLKRLRKHGFMSKNTTKDGRNLLKRRRLKGRENLTTV